MGDRRLTTEELIDLLESSTRYGPQDGPAEARFIKLSDAAAGQITEVLRAGKGRRSRRRSESED